MRNFVIKSIVALSIIISLPLAVYKDDIFPLNKHEIVMDEMFPVSRHDIIMRMLLPVVHGKVLDVGCAEGLVSAMVMEESNKIESIQGIDPYLPNKTHIPAQYFDGVNIPFEDNQFDTVIASFILHHAATEDADELISEMKRVGNRIVVLEDNVDSWTALWTAHFLHFWMSTPLLADMPYNEDGFHSSKEWEQIFEKHDLRIVAQQDYSSSMPFFPFLAHSVYVLEDDNTIITAGEPIELYKPSIHLVDALNYGVIVLPLLLVACGTAYIHNSKK